MKQHLPAVVLLARGLTTQCALAQICDDSAARGNPADGAIAGVGDIETARVAGRIDRHAGGLTE